MEKAPTQGQDAPEATPLPKARRMPTGRPWTSETAPRQGRPPGTVGGRVASLNTLDQMLNAAGNQELLRIALQQAFVKNPLKFFQKFVMPLMPKDYLVKAGGEQGAIRWMSILEQYPTKPSDTSPTEDNSTSTVIEITASEPYAADAAGAKPDSQQPN